MPRTGHNPGAASRRDTCGNVARSPGFPRPAVPWLMAHALISELGRVSLPGGARGLEPLAPSLQTNGGAVSESHQRTSLGW